MGKGLPPLPPPPPPIEVYQDLQWAYAGFWRLSNARPIGMAGPLRIPFSEIAGYCQLLGYDNEKRLDFLYYTERLDDKFMEYVKKKQDEEEQKKAMKNGAPRPNPARR